MHCTSVNDGQRLESMALSSAVVDEGVYEEEMMEEEMEEEVDEEMDMQCTHSE